MKMVSMAQEMGAADSIYATAAPMAPSPYPYGLRINLSQEQLEKLGYSDLPPAGTEIHLEAKGIVTRSCTEDPDADGDIDYVCVELQITEMGAEESDESAGENEDDDAGDSAGRAERLYGKGKEAA